MFDSPTAELIASAPALEGLNLADLPKELTRAYSTIVSLRIRLRESKEAQVPDQELSQLIGKLERLGYAQEAFAAVAPERPNRAAAAYVAASAHQLRFAAERLLRGEKQEGSQLTVEAVGAEIAGTIMFLIADRVADAAQMSRSIALEQTPSVEDQLRRAIANLARGSLIPIVEGNWAPTFVSGERVDAAVQLLWWRLLQGLRILARDLLGFGETAVVEGGSAAVFAEVRNLSVDLLDIGGTSQVVNAFPGPHHLASLLQMADGVLRQAALVGIDNPKAGDDSGWSSFLRSLALRRPYLWPNHHKAISAGYLNPGTSAVVSFPTGAGKSTLTELKIAVARLSGKKVVYLAPTLALVAQVAADLRRTFPEVGGSSADELAPQDLTPVSVMTPERCLTVLGFTPESFAEVGLLVFDECHMMHPQDGSSRRSVDAMLCLLAFFRAATGADVLLVSAMIKNADALAGWITSLVDRPVIALASEWKPTRQARGCVVYDGKRVGEMRNLVKANAAKTRTKTISASVSNLLTAKPFGVFSLLQTWNSNLWRDYALLPLLEGTVKLGAKKVSASLAYLTSNRNEVAAEIGARSADQGIKTLIFAQTIPFCSSIQKKLDALMNVSSVQLNASEKKHRQYAVLELGGTEHTYCHLEARVACHHGLLLPSERVVNESLFRRPDGIGVLVATSTLAQGMNLPSQLVIIAGDDKYDLEKNKTQLLEAHNLLNAAGRAGRAGEAAEGMVILIPGRVVEYLEKDDHSEKEHTLSPRFFELKAIFSNSDQCLELEDPLEPLLDMIHSAAHDDELSDYLVRRLPIKVGQGEDLAQDLLKNSFCSYKHQQAGDAKWIEERVSAAMRRRQEIIADPNSYDWKDELASNTGVLSSPQIAVLVKSMKETISEPIGTPEEWIHWGLQWLLANPSILTDIVRPTTIVGVFGKKAAGSIATDEEQRALVLSRIAKAIPQWIGGVPLCHIEETLNDKPSLKCEAAREWALRLAPELAYFFSLVTQVYKRMREADGEISVVLPVGFAMHGRCVREGFDTVEKLALFQAELGKVPRVAIHQIWEKIENRVSLASEYEAFPDLVRRLRRAVGVNAAGDLLELPQDELEESSNLVDGFLAKIESGARADLAAELKSAISEAVSSLSVYAEASSAHQFEADSVEVAFKAYSFEKIFASGSATQAYEFTVEQSAVDTIVVRVPIRIEAEATADFSYSIWDSIDKEYFHLGSSSEQRDINFEAAVLVTFVGDFKDEENIEITDIDVVDTPDSIDFGDVEMDYDDDPSYE